jgi:hypothetical protein
MPLASFQNRPLSQDGMLRLVWDMNAVREQPLPPQQVEQLFGGMWPLLESVVAEEVAPTVADSSRPLSDLRVDGRSV